MKNSFFLLFSAFAHLLSFANSNDIEKVNVIPTKIGTKTEATIPDLSSDQAKKSCSFHSNPIVNIFYQ